MAPAAALREVAGPQPLGGVRRPVGGVPRAAVGRLWPGAVAPPARPPSGRRWLPESVERPSEMWTPARVEACCHNRYEHTKRVVMETVLKGLEG